jgi:protein-disulfide isomerase
MKGFIGIILLTILILIAGIYFGTQTDVAGATTISSKILLGNKKHIIDAPQSKLTLVEFADFQCPACGDAHPYVKEILDTYKGKITFIYRHFPLPQHKNAILAAKAAEAAGEQGKFWEMYDVLYEGQAAWSETTNSPAIFTSYATSLNLNIAEFTKSIHSTKFDDAIQADYADGLRVGVNSTPTFFLNGKKLTLRSFTDLSQAVEKELSYE